MDYSVGSTIFGVGIIVVLSIAVPFLIRGYVATKRNDDKKIKEFNEKTPKIIKICNCIMLIVLAIIALLSLSLN